MLTILMYSACLSCVQEVTVVFHVPQKNSTARKGETPLKPHYFQPGARGLFCPHLCPLVQSWELAESLTTAGPGPGLCSGFLRNVQLTPKSAE